MIVPPVVALFAWVPISLLVFRRYPIRKAMLFNFVGGWTVLPAANYASIGGLAYIPLCIFEMIRGPRIYAWLYGYLPFQWNGAQRFLGYRPIGLLENGNQLGIWMATASLIALWLWRRETAKAILGIPMP